jgi:hypothetical protein
VLAIYALDEEHVYIGGTFSTMQDIPVYQLIMWNGKTNIFTAFGGQVLSFSNTTGRIHAIHALDAEHVYIGGEFLTISGITYNGITMWNGTTNTFTALGAGVLDSNSRSYVYAIYALDATHVYIGGTFSTVGGVSGYNNVTMWNGATFIKLSSGVNSAVDAIYALDAEHVYIGGLFTTAGGNSTIKYITMWNGSSYTQLGTTMPSARVYTIRALDAEHIYIGGLFKTIGVITYNGVAMWNQNTQSMTPLGIPPTNVGVIDSYLNVYVYAIYALDAEHIYIGGRFTTAGNITATLIVVWNQITQTFSALGGGLSSSLAIASGNIYVKAIYALDAEHVYLGGRFATANNTTGSIIVNNITMWTG